MTDIERRNLIATLNLEYGATYRYLLQAQRFLSPRAVALIEGVRRNEADHIAFMLNLLENDITEAPEGFKTLYLHLKLNLAFEQEAVKFYGQFSREAEDPAIRDTFRTLLKSEAGHVRLFEEMIKALEEGSFPRIFLCPLCGWEINYGPGAGAGAVQKCEKCGARFELILENGDFALKAA
ncbi:MAG: hypothetical protein C4524_11790 [Candidatus Zixiibacteriota bacterium]|nr:MAG: hypothetical protein C4524_11790 [candidate division Zixibacteria bacterium]